MIFFFLHTADKASGSQSWIQTLESLDLIRPGMNSTVSERMVDISPCVNSSSGGIVCSVIKPAKLHVRRPSLSFVTASLSLESHEPVSTLCLCSTTPSSHAIDEVPPEEAPSSHAIDELPPEEAPSSHAINDLPPEEEKSKDRQKNRKHFNGRTIRKDWVNQHSHSSLKNSLIFVSVASNVFLFSFLMWHIYWPTLFDNLLQYMC